MFCYLVSVFCLTTFKNLSAFDGEVVVVVVIVLVERGKSMKMCSNQQRKRKRNRKAPTTGTTIHEMIYVQKIVTTSTKYPIPGTINCSATVGLPVPQEISTLREELARLRHEAERDRRAKTAAEMERQKAASVAREESRERERTLADLKVRMTSSFGPPLDFIKSKQK